MIRLFALAFALLALLTVSSFAQNSSTEMETEEKNQVKSTETEHPDDEKTESAEDNPHQPGFGIGTGLTDPTALNGSSRRPVTLFESNRVNSTDIGAFYRFGIDDNQSLLVEGLFSPKLLGVDVGYSITPRGWRGSLAANIWVSSGNFPAFDASGFEVFLPDNQEPYLQMFGGGLEYLHPFSDELKVAFGLNYTQYAFSDEFFAGTRFPTTQQGFPLTVSEVNSTERFLSLKLHGAYDTLDDPILPMNGTKIRLGLEQAFELGSSSTSFTKAELNVGTLFSGKGFAEKEQTLLFNFQGGTILGDPPSISAFHLGGPNGNRGYQPGEFAEGKSFIVTTVEYRHDLFDFTAFENDMTARLALFHDYSTVLGTQSQLRGLPDQLALKPNQGSGYGLGLHFAGELGLFKLETAWNEEGQNNFIFTLGERF